jgi:hypothetical protein
MEDGSGTCTGCKQRVPDLRRHQQQCTLWHMTQVIAKKNNRKHHAKTIPNKSQA